MIKYLTFSFAISTISWAIGIVVNAILIRSPFYYQKLSNLNFIKSDRLNKLIGIEIFKRMIIFSPLKYFNPKLSIKKQVKVSELPDLRREMTIAEISHLIAFAFVMIFVIIKLLNGQYAFALVMLMINILMNLYPSLLQQQNKRRIDKFNQIMTLREAVPHLSEV